MVRINSANNGTWNREDGATYETVGAALEALRCYVSSSRWSDIVVVEWPSGAHGVYWSAEDADRDTTGEFAAAVIEDAD